MSDNGTWVREFSSKNHLAWNVLTIKRKEKDEKYNTIDSGGSAGGGSGVYSPLTNRQFPFGTEFDIIE